MVSVLNNPLPVPALKAFRRVLAAVGEPWRLARRGRPPKRKPRAYALALFVKAYWGWALREAECVLRIPKSSLHWASKRLRDAWVRALVARTAARLRREHAAACSILDSTGVSWSPLGCKRRFERRPYGQLHAMVEYAPKAHAVWFSDAIATASPRGDAPMGERLLASEHALRLRCCWRTKVTTRFRCTASLFGVGGACACASARTASGTAACEWNRGLRGRVLREYDDDEYRALRGRVEAPFGGFARRYASRLHERLASTRKTACLLWVVAHNVRTIARTIRSYWQDLLDSLLILQRPKQADSSFV